MFRRFLTLKHCGCSTLIDRQSKRYRSEIKKVLKVAVIGTPNAGKSTLVNNIVGNRVSAITHIPHTTRSHANGILNIDETQIVFTDTPGAVNWEEGRRLRLHRNHIRLPNMVASEADLIAVVFDPTNRKTKTYIDESVLRIILSYQNIPTILILNKIDRIKNKRTLLPIAAGLLEDREKDEWGYKNYGGSSTFKEVFYISALHEDGLDQLLEYLLSQAKPGKHMYSSEIYSDTSVHKAIAEVFREKLMLIHGQEIPWHVRQETVIFKADQTSQIARVHQMLWWPRDRQMQLVEKRRDELQQSCVDELSNMFRCEVNLSFEIAVAPNMTRDDVYM